jgi:hypothetical protein
MRRFFVQYVQYVQCALAGYKCMFIWLHHCSTKRWFRVKFVNLNSEQHLEHLKIPNDIQKATSSLMTGS